MNCYNGTNEVFTPHLLALGLIPLAWFISLIITWLFSLAKSTINILDHPNARSLHNKPVPRTGGIAIMATLTMAYLAAQALCNFDDTLNYIAAGTFLLILVSVWEDFNELSPSFRLAMHFLAASIPYALDLGLQEISLGTVEIMLPPLITGVIVIFGTLWMTNLYNFMDGMDGFAAGMTIIGFSTLALLGWIGGKYDLMLINSIIVAVVGGFLLWNFPPAKIFMGDTGSIPLGYLAAVISLVAIKQHIISLLGALILFSPFVVDATLTLVRRLWQRENIFTAHRSHYYQKLVRSGWGHRKTVLYAYALMSCCAIAAIATNYLPPAQKLRLILTWVGLYTAIIWRIEVLLRLKAQQNST